MKMAFKKKNTHDFYVSKLNILKTTGNQNFNSLTVSWSKPQVFVTRGSST